MTKNPDYQIILFKSVSHTMKSEKLLKKGGVSYKLIPIPKSISSDCGVCIRFNSEDTEKIKELLTGKINYTSIRPLKDAGK